MKRCLNSATLCALLLQLLLPAELSSTTCPERPLPLVPRRAGAHDVKIDGTQHVCAEPHSANCCSWIQCVSKRDDFEGSGLPPWRKLNSLRGGVVTRSGKRTTVRPMNGNAPAMAGSPREGKRARVSGRGTGGGSPHHVSPATRAEEFERSRPGDNDGTVSVHGKVATPERRRKGSASQAGKAALGEAAGRAKTEARVPPPSTRAPAPSGRAFAPDTVGEGVEALSWVPGASMLKRRRNKLPREKRPVRGADSGGASAARGKGEKAKGSSGRREGDRKGREVGPRAAPVQKPALASTAATAGAGPGVGLLLPAGAVQAKLMKWLPGGAVDGAPVGPSAKKRAVCATFQAQRATARARVAPRCDMSERAPRLQARKEEREGKKLVERRARERAAAKKGQPLHKHHQPWLRQVRDSSARPGPAAGPAAYGCVFAARQNQKRPDAPYEILRRTEEGNHILQVQNRNCARLFERFGQGALQRCACSARCV
jgi:hypothetical protein